MEDSGWINITKLCKEKGKNFKDWYNTESSFQLMLNLGKYIHDTKKEVYESCEKEYPNNDCLNIHLIKHVKIIHNFTAYIHPYLFSYVKAWLDPSFAYELGSYLSEQKEQNDIISDKDIKEGNDIFIKIIDLLQTQEIYNKHILQLVTILMNK